MNMMEAVSVIDGCESVEELRLKLHAIIQDYGFAYFAFLDLGGPSLEAPFVVATIEAAWDSDYRSYGFVHVDPILPAVRRANRPFRWGDVRLPTRLGKRKSGALKTMEAAQDHGLREGYVVPFHYVDHIGRMNSASCVLFWKDDVRSFKRVTQREASNLNIIIIYFSQKVLQFVPLARLVKHQNAGNEVEIALTDQERRVLFWASHGKTMNETATIMAIKGDTVETYARTAMRKLNAVNKTQAVVKAIRHGLIDI